MHTGFLAGKREGKRPLGGSGCRWEDITTLDRQVIGWGGVNWINLNHYTDKRQALVNAVMCPWIL
jgi:hypothetical protein